MTFDFDSGLRNRLDSLLRRCIECGLCLPHCATYLATGNEVDSPRGRLLLIGDLISAGAGGVEDETFTALSRCLGCRSCETACPSGVPSELLDRGRELARREHPIRSFISPERLTQLAVIGDFAESLAWSVAGPSWRSRLGASLPPVGRLVRLLGSRPSAADHDTELCELLDALTGLETVIRPLPCPAAELGTLTLLEGCANRSFLPGPQRRLKALLEAAGWRVECPGNQDCCGALDDHAGRSARAEVRRATTREALAGSLGRSGRLVVEAAGCGLTMTDALATEDVTVVDALVVLAEGGLPPLRPVPLRVVYHDPCHARHGQGIVTEPRALLDRIPELERVETEEAEVCCGSGGGYALEHPDLSEVMGRRKVSMLVQTGAELIVTSNPGCLGQIRDGLLAVQDDRLVLPLSDLIWYAAQTDSPGC